MSEQDTFLIDGGVTFGPAYIPTRFSIKKDRNLNREDNFCGNEDISDLGSKNREIHISGPLREDEIGAFGDLLDHNDPLGIVTPGWGGEIRIKGGEYEGPRSIDPRSGQALYKFTLDVVSTGRDEAQGHGHENGIVDDGHKLRHGGRVVR